MVGPTAEELESVKELIHFDHTYLKSSVVKNDISPTYTFDTNLTSQVQKLNDIEELLLTNAMQTSEPAPVIDIISKETIMPKQEDNFVVKSPVYTWSTSSDSGYSDYDANSPMSDVSSGNGLGDDIWEESFTELFPTLL